MNAANIPMVPRSGSDDRRRETGRPADEHDPFDFDPILDTQWLTMAVGRTAYIF